MFIQTRNNLKGQLGFNTNHLSTPVKPPASGLASANVTTSTLTNNTTKLASMNSDSIDSTGSNTSNTPQLEFSDQPAKPGEYDAIRRHRYVYFKNMGYILILKLEFPLEMYVFWAVFEKSNSARFFSPKYCQEIEMSSMLRVKKTLQLDSFSLKYTNGWIS